MGCNCCYVDDGSEPTIYVTPETRIIVQEYLLNRRLRKEKKKNPSSKIVKTPMEGVLMNDTVPVI